MMSDHAKRTRSQLALPEEFGEVHFGISPLRAARQERRRNLQTDFSVDSSAPHATSNVGVHDGDQSDDELLLSPPKIRSQKRPSFSQEPEHPLESDTERQFKRFKRGHDDEQSRVAEIMQPSGPFDFSAIIPEQLLSSMDSGQPGSSSKRRAQTVPLVSPSIPHRDLGQLMPSPRKTYLVPPAREVLRFSSLPRTFQPLTDAMDVDNTTKLSQESGRDKSSAESRTPPPPAPPPKALDSFSQCEIPATEDNTLLPSHNQTPSVPSGLEAIASKESPATPLLSLDVRMMTPRVSPEELDNDATPKPINQFPTFPLNADPISVSLGGPSMPDDPPSPLSTLSSLSDLDHSSPPHDPEIHTPSVEPPSGLPRVTQPPPSSLSRNAVADSIVALPHVKRLATSIASRGKGRRGFARPTGSARLTRSASIKKQKEARSVDRDINARPLCILSDPSGPSSVATTQSSDSLALTPAFSKTSSMTVSHKKPFSFAMPTSSSMNKTVEKAPTSSPQKPWLPKRQPPKLPSPAKPASSLGSGNPPPPLKHTGLSNLSLALEKLKIPRPATTLGFNRDAHSMSNVLDSRHAPKAKDDSIVRLGSGLPSSARATATPLRRVVTVGSIANREPNAHASSSKPTAPSAQPSDAGPSAKRINLYSGVIVGKNSFSKPQGVMFGGVGKKRPFEKVSKKSSLPVVEASPVKEASSARAINLDEPPLPSTSEMFTATSASHDKDNDEAAPLTVLAVEPMKSQDPFAEHATVLGAGGEFAEDDKVEAADAWKHACRRASLASQFLQQTLAVLPSTPTPPKASGSKSKVAERSQSSSQRTRSGLRSGSNSDIAVPRLPVKGHEAGAHVSRSGSIAAASPSAKPSSLKVLKTCTIFVDVRTDDGDEAGGLFVDMLRGLGAKIIGRAGQSCTHIVYKNGLMSTLTKYRLMREPKPFVVGISWVVECAEQCRRVEEDKFLVDLEGLNVAGNNKRRRSMLPKHISSRMQTHAMAPPPVPGPSLTGTLTSDQSMDRSSVGADHSLNSSDGVVEDEDDLPPLERARQRRNIFF